MTKNIYKHKWENIWLCFGCALTLFLSSMFFCIPYALAEEPKQLDNISQTEEMLMTGLVDLTLLINNASGNIEEILIGDEFQEEIVLTGRTAFFLKGKLKGKYLLTARFDTGAGKPNELWQDIFVQNTGNTISRIEPERYYPVYGDDSTVVNMVGDQGKLYVNHSWNNTELLWGNYRYSNNQNELLKYNRSLYGFKFKTGFGTGDLKEEMMGEESHPDTQEIEDLSEDKQSAQQNEVKSDKNTRLDIKGFWSSPESVHAHNELEIVGGMLYYLKHGNLITGSDNIRIAVRDNLTQEVEESIQLTAGVDYDIDYLSGRIILKSSLNDYLYDEGDERVSYLITDYEYEPAADPAEQSGYGVNMVLEYKNSNLSSTYTTETAIDGGRYRSTGIRYNYLNKDYDFAVEWANTQDKLANQYLSGDGGLTYNLMANPDIVDSANAYRVRYRTELKNKDSRDRELPGIDMTLAYSHKDKGFSSQQSNIEEDTDSYNLQFEGGNEKLSYITRYFAEIKEKSGRSRTIDLKVNKEMNEKLNLAGELRQTSTMDNLSNSSSQLTTGIDFTYQIDENKEIYGGQDLSLSGKKLNKTTLGAKLKPQDNITLDAAVIMDNTARSANDKYKIGGSYQHKYGEVYSNYTAGSAGDTSLLIGGNTDLNEKTDIYVEHKNSSDIDENSDSNLIGVKYNLNDNWALAFDYTRSNVSKEDDSRLTRDIITPAVVYRGDALTYRARMEYRKEQGDEDLTQYVFTSGFNREYNEELSVLFKLDYSLTERDNDIDENDSFTEAQLGLAYRPIYHDRLNLLAMYTYQEEYKPEDQENVSEYNERSNIFSLEGIYGLNSRWQLGEKLAWRGSELISDSLSAASDTYLWINRLNYIIDDDWDLYGEYRILQNTRAEDQKSGFLLGINRDLDENTQLGVGYNFTDFNDDLSNLGYNYQGLFVNLVRKW